VDDIAGLSALEDLDKNIVAMFQNGDKASYLKLYNKYAPAVLGILTRCLGDKNLAEECTQDTFCKIWHERLQYDPEKERLFTWMLKVAKSSNLYGTLMADRKVDDEIREEFDLIYATDIKSYLQQKVLEEGSNFEVNVNVTISKAIRLIYFESYTFAATADELGISVDALRAEMVKTIKQLKGSVLA